MNIALSSLLIFLVSIIIFHVYCNVARHTRLMDVPNERSLHTHPTIRGGGIVFISLFLGSFLFIKYSTQTQLNELSLFMISTLILALISFFDDLYHLSARLRFLIQSLVALMVILFIRPQELEFFLFSITNQYIIAIFLFLTLIWAINHFNFMDGLDGFCAMQSVFLLAAYAFFFSINVGLIPQQLCWILECSLLGFLLFNFPPATLFMGDVGSVSLGFIIFVMAIIGQKNYQIPIVYWFVLNGLFLFDATITLFRRVWNKEKWFTAHKKHAYQRLRQFGLSSKHILLGQLVLNTVFFVLVMLQHYLLFHLAVVVLIQLGIMVFIYFLIERCFPMYGRE